MVPENARIVVMWSQSAARNRVDAIMEKCKNTLLVGPRNNIVKTRMDGRYGIGPTSVITKALVAGVKLPEFNQKVLRMVDMAGD